MNFIAVRATLFIQSAYGYSILLTLAGKIAVSHSPHLGLKPVVPPKKVNNQLYGRDVLLHWNDTVERKYFVSNAVIPPCTFPLKGH